jgi:Protein of unknown function (DUF2934)
MPSVSLRAVDALRGMFDGTDSMAESRDERIRRRAYEIWHREGGGHGRHEDHWRQAATEIDAEDRAAESGAAEQAGSAEPATEPDASGGDRPRKTAAEHAPGEPTVAASGRSAGEATRQNGPGNEPARPDEAAQAATDDAGGAPARRRKPRSRDVEIKASNAAATDNTRQR